MSAARSSAKGNGQTQAESIDYAIFKITLSDDQLELLADKVAARLAGQLPAAQQRRLDDDAILDSGEAVEYLRMPSLDALHRETAAGTIPSLQRKPRGRLKFRKRDLDDWLAGDV